MAGLDTPRSLAIAMMVKHGEWAQIMQLDCDPLRYLSAEAYLRDTAATDFLRKLEVTVPGLDPDLAARHSWWEAEKQCFLTNRRLYEIMDFGTLGGLPIDPALSAFIRQVRKNVAWLIGDKPPELPRGRFGPGATMSDTARRTTVPHKMSSSPTLTSSALYYSVPWTGTAWASACGKRGDGLSVVKGNSFFTVPKTAKTHRPCAKEPSVNSFYQLGMGRVLRSRLKSRGFDLEHGQDVHRRVACAASISGEFCTIDLSSASDTVCKSLVKLLLPEAWFEELDALRSHQTFIDGKWVLLEKFSSMGNGFTFELETALFCAISMAACSDTIGAQVYVYGDDIIVPVGRARDVLGALSFFGMTPNKSKTFVTGPFRESCGGDFFEGKPVRAHFLKEVPNEPQQYISLANGIRRLSRQLGEGSRLYWDLQRTWFVCLDLLPSDIRRCRGPEALGDVVIHDERERWTTRWRNCIRYVRSYRPARFQRVSFDRFDPDVQFAAALYGVTLEGPIKAWREGLDRRGINLRDGVLGYKVGWVPFS
ncbi:MAG: RNA replicase beta chain [Sanya fiers-like virus 35]|nr:MAG: RNA replicase beta chain [Sanya fiers-like virus 35]